MEPGDFGDVGDGLKAVVDLGKAGVTVVVGVN